MFRILPAPSLVAGFLAAAACQPAPGATSDSDDTTGSPDLGSPEDSADLFSLDYLPTFRITLDDAAWAALEAEPKVWVQGTFEHDGQVFDPVGVRLKGNHSFRPLADKPAFKVKFNEYTPGVRFLGLEELVLNNMVIDRSMLREWVSYRVFRAVGAPAPRVGYAEVVLNDEPYGLYLNIESYDDEFLARVYGDPSGNLYEEENSADVDDDPAKWDQDEGADKSREDLVALAALANLPDDTIFYGDQAVVDMPRFLGFMIGEIITGHFDGYIASHNFMIYHEPAVDLWSFLPWSLDQSLIRKSTPYEHKGFLAAKCLFSSRCLVDYVELANDAVNTFAALDLQGDIDKIEALTIDAVLGDTHKPHTNEQVQAARDSTRSWLAGRAEELLPALACLENGVEPDPDGDGFGPCFQDCDESNPNINPDAFEACDLIDNDCTGWIDDVPACDCPSIVSEGRTFYACLNHLRWVDGEDFCQAQGRQLAKFDSVTQTEEVWAFASGIEASRWAIGLNDRASEETYVWPDGSAPSFDLWATNEPAHQLDWFDCVFLAGGRWYELNCIEQGSFLCSD